jgi:hypothetical protein
LAFLAFYGRIFECESEENDETKIYFTAGLRGLRRTACSLRKGQG